MLHFPVLLMILALDFHSGAVDICEGDKTFWRKETCLFLRDAAWIDLSVRHPKYSSWRRTVNTTIDLIQTVFSVIGNSYTTCVSKAMWPVRMMNRSCIETCQLQSHAFQKCCCQSRRKLLSCKMLWSIWLFVTLIPLQISSSRLAVVWWIMQN